MGIENTIAKLCSQTAIYWGTPVRDSYNNITYDSPVEIPCRWQDIQQFITDKKGDQTTSMAMVYVTQDVDEEGVLYLGNLNDLSSEQETDPNLLDKAYKIKRFEKIPSLHSSSEFLRKVYLSFRISMGGF